MASAINQNATKAEDLAYRLESVGLRARAANEIEDDLGGLEEVGVRGELGVPLSFLHRLQEGAVVASHLRETPAMAPVLQSRKEKSREKHFALETMQLRDRWMERPVGQAQFHRFGSCSCDSSLKAQHNMMT
ncbi:hypothetical protein NL676_005054 [Syzygium grande]|nr:hypothetical protein NL676_005054 [Syzygium grande]